MEDIIGGLAITLCQAGLKVVNPQGMHFYLFFYFFIMAVCLMISDHCGGVLELYLP